MAAQQAAEKAVKFGVKEVDVKVKGPGSGRGKRDHRPASGRADDQVDRGRHAAAAQRLPAQEAPPRLTRPTPRITPGRQCFVATRSTISISTSSNLVN